MNILVINWQDIKNPLGGGAEVHFHEIFKRIAARGHKVTLYCCRFKGAPKEEWIDGIRVIRGGTRNLFNYFVPFRYLFQLRRQKYDAVIDDLNKIPFFTPLFVKRPLIGIVHHLFGKSIFVEATAPAAWYVYLFERAALPVYRKIPVAVVSESTKQEMLREGFSADRLPIVPNCVDHSLYKPPAQRPVSGLNVGYIGRLKKYKSADHLLRAFVPVLAQFPDARLTVIGDGDAKRGLEELARELGIAQAVRFTGFLTETAKVEELQKLDFVVNTSAKEGWGLTVIESNACGVPVIASNVPGLRDSVLDGKTGILYEYGNIPQLTGAIVKLMTDHPLRERMSAEALRWAQEFDWGRSADTMLEVIEGEAKSKTK